MKEFPFPFEDLLESRSRERTDKNEQSIQMGTWKWRRTKHIPISKLLVNAWKLLDFCLFIEGSLKLCDQFSHERVHSGARILIRR